MVDIICCVLKNVEEVKCFKVIISGDIIVKVNSDVVIVLVVKFDIIWNVFKKFILIIVDGVIYNVIFNIYLNF